VNHFELTFERGGFLAMKDSLGEVLLQQLGECGEGVVTTVQGFMSSSNVRRVPSQCQDPIVPRGRYADQRRHDFRDGYFSRLLALHHFLALVLHCTSSIWGT